MKKCYYFIFIFLSLSIAFSACDNGSNKKKGGHAGTLRGVIDISNDSTTGYTFGYRTTENAKRFQTIIAGSLTRLDAVEVQIRKKRSDQTYNNITVEL
jgi:hypothetical protein